MQVEIYVEGQGWIVLPATKPFTGFRFDTGGPVYRDPILDGMTDGWDHHRIHPAGICLDCTAAANEEHRGMIASRAPDTPIYDRLRDQAIEERDLRHRMFMKGFGPLTIEAGVKFWRRHQERMGL